MGEQFIAHLEPTDSRGKCITDASLELGPQPNINIFFHEQFQHLSSRLAKVEAQLGAIIANTRILSRNRQYQDRCPLQKYVSPLTMPSTFKAQV